MAQTPTPAAPALPVPAIDPRAALDVALDAARIADPVLTGPDGRQYAALPKTHQMTELADRRQLPAWPTEALTFDDQASIIAYVNRFSNECSILIADYTAQTITARLDWHPHNETQSFQAVSPDAHSATLRLMNSEEFARWSAMEGKMHDQAEFARFLEENSTDIGSPDPAVMIEIARDFEATAGAIYKSSVRLDNGDAATCVARFRNLATGLISMFPPCPDWETQKAAQDHIRKHIADLRGKNLACWCKPGQPCHASVLLEIANVE